MMPQVFDECVRKVQVFNKLVRGLVSELFFNLCLEEQEAICHTLRQFIFLPDPKPCNCHDPNMIAVLGLSNLSVPVVLCLQVSLHLTSS